MIWPTTSATPPAFWMTTDPPPGRKKHKRVSGYSGKTYRDSDMSRDSSRNNGSSYGCIWPMMNTRPMPRGYSRADRMDELVQAMGGAMNDMPEDLRREAQRFITKMQQQM